MNKYLNSIFGVSISKMMFLLFVTMIFGSWDIPDEIKDLGAKIGQKRYHTNLNIYLFKDIKMRDTLERQTVVFRVYNNYMYYKLENYEAYANAKHEIIIDHTKKIILINDNRPGKPFKVNLKMDMIDIDTLLSLNYDFKLARNTPFSRTYVVSTSTPDREIDYLNFSFNPTLLIPQKIVLKYNKDLDYLLSNIKHKNNVNKNEQKPLLVMVYEDFKYDKSFEPSYFKHEHILTIGKKNAAVVADRYKSYKIFNYLNQK